MSNELIEELKFAERGKMTKLEHLRGKCGTMFNIIFKPEEVLELLNLVENELDAYKKDAERYRWVRERDVIDWDSMPCVPDLPVEWEGWDSPRMMLDAAIDAAIAKLSADKGEK